MRRRRGWREVCSREKDRRGNDKQADEIRTGLERKRPRVAGKQSIVPALLVKDWCEGFGIPSSVGRDWCEILEYQLCWRKIGSMRFWEAELDVEQAFSRQERWKAYWWLKML